MADSNITKRALAAAFKDLMHELPFEKINVRQICEKCDMNRKSFYYHFRDKYDLMNWVFDTEFIDVINCNGYEDDWELLYELCRYFYENAGFYCKALQIRGQNSFIEHFREMMYPIISAQLDDTMTSGEAKKFQINFVSDAIVFSIVRWLTEKDRLPPDQFIEMVHDCVVSMARYAICSEQQRIEKRAAKTT